MEEPLTADRPTPAVRGRCGRRWCIALATSLLALTPAAAACGAGQVAQTTEQVTSAAGGRVNEISVLDVEFLFHPPIAGDEVYEVGDTAPLAATIVNHGREADRLVQVTSPIAMRGLVDAAASVTIPGGQTLTAGQTGPVSSIEVPYENDIGVIALVGLREPIRSGLTYPVVFGFERAGDVVIEVPVDTPDLPRREPLERA